MTAESAINVTLSDVTTPRLRDRQREQTHAALRQAAFELVESAGLDAVTVAQIARRAGTSERTFFTHFRTKEEALAPRLTPLSADAVTSFLAADEPDLLRALAVLLAAQRADMRVANEPGGPDPVMRLVTKNPTLMPQFLAVFNSVDLQLRDLIAQRLGAKPDDLLCRGAAVIAMSALRLATETWPATRGGKAGKPMTAGHIAKVFEQLRALLVT